MVNCYKRQMSKLGVGIERYAELLEMPKEIVKKIVNNENLEGSIDMNNFLRKNMFNKHQEIENNLENVKLQLQKENIEKGNELEPITNDKIDLLTKIHGEDDIYLNWYKYEYNLKDLLEKTNSKSMLDFGTKFKFFSNAGRSGGIISKATLNRVLKKDENISADVLYDIIKQLYHINETGTQPIFDETNMKKSELNRDENLFNWYQNFDLKTFLKQNKISNYDFANTLDISLGTTSNLKSKNNKHYTPSNSMMIKLKNFVENYDKPSNETMIEDEQPTISINENYQDVPVTILENKSMPSYSNFDENDVVGDIKFIKTKDDTEKIEFITGKENDTETILRNLLINRLTEEEKYLIRIFGGTI